jgi:hypothetical protein
VPPMFRTDDFDAGTIAYGETFQSELMSQLASIEPQLAEGLSFAPFGSAPGPNSSYMGPDALILTVVPEPGALVLLISGVLGVVLLVWRRRRRR